MPNILIIGATGYIGHPLTLSLSRSGLHTIYGLARTPSSAQLLASQNITPIHGTISSLTRTSLQTIDLVLDVSGAGPESRELLNLCIKTGQQRLEQDHNERQGKKLAYIYVSGTWVHGSSPLPITDLIPAGTPSSPTPPAKLVAWRAELEHEILAPSTREVLDILIVRPALVYGRESTIWTSLFNPLLLAANEARTGGTTEIGKVKIPIAPESKPGLVHVDDVVSALHAAVDFLSLPTTPAESASTTPSPSPSPIYPVFDLITTQESMQAILDTAAREFGWQGDVELVGPGEDLFMDAMGTTFNGDSSRAKEILGWKPRRGEGFVGGICGQGGFVREWMEGREGREV